MMNSPRTPQGTSLSAELKDIIQNRNILTTRTRMKVLNDLDELQHEETRKKALRLRAQTIQEVLTSEVSYLRQLEIIMEYFMKPILEKQFLSHASYTTLFENIETLYNVNGELLKELKENPDNIAKAFCKLAPYFKLYSVYAYNYKRALLLLQDIQQNDFTASKFISNQETRPEVNNKLSALLIAPIQRIPRYKLLLQEILRHTSAKDSDYKDLQISLVEITKVAKHVNSLVAEYEDTQKLLELQKRIVGSINLVKPGRKLIRQGPLMRVSRKGNSSFRRHFILLSDTLLYCKGNPDNSLSVCCLLPLNKCKIERILSNGLFKVTCMHEVLLLYSENGDSEDWIETLQEAAKKYIECRKTLRKDSSSRIPMRTIQSLQSEDILAHRTFRKKRPLSQSSEESNTSNIIYVNRDTEPDGSSEYLNLFSAIKRFKKSTTDDTSVHKLKNFMGGLRRKSCENEAPNNFFHQTKNQKNHNVVFKHSNENIQNRKDSNNKSMTEGFLYLNDVGKFFSNMGRSLKGFFRRS